MGIKHSTVVIVPDDPAKPVGTDEWNDDHTVDGDVNLNGHSILNCANLVGGSGNLDWIVVTDFGAVGNGIADDTAAVQSAVDQAFGSVASPHGAGNAHLNRPLYFPAGTYKITSQINLSRALQGARIMGAGRFATTIDQVTADAHAFHTDGFNYSEVSDMEIRCPTGTILSRCFDYDWQGPGVTGGSGHQSCTFRNIQFTSGGYGVYIADQSYQGSENLFIECFFGGQRVAAIKTDGFNALQQTVIACNFAGIDIGLTGSGAAAIYCDSGAFPIILGCGFQVNGTHDIVCNNSADDCWFIAGCRTESNTLSNSAFFRAGGLVSSTISNCTQLAANTADATFVDAGNCATTIEQCQSVYGAIRGTGPITVRNSAFGRTPLMDATAPDTDTGQLLVLTGIGSMGDLPSTVEVENVQLGATYNISVGVQSTVRKKRIDANGPHDYALTGPPGTTLYGGAGTIQGGSIRTHTDFLYIDTEGFAAADDLDSIVTFPAFLGPLFSGQRLTLRTVSSARVVTVKDGTGNLALAGDFVMDNTADTLSLIYDEGLVKWLEVARSNNG